MMEAGSDTSAPIVIAFGQTIVRYSRVQKKAQRQIDEVFRPDRTPQWSDYSKLPYVTQSVNEPNRSSLCAQGSPPSITQKLGIKVVFN